MDSDSPFSLYENNGESKIIAPMASPPVDTISLGRPFGMEHPYHPWASDRKKRLEDHLLPLEKCAIGVPYFIPKLEPAYGNTTYHLTGAFGEDSGFYGVVSSDFDHPPPFRVAAADLSSISETDRSPSPQAYIHYGFSDIHAVDVDGTHRSFPRVCRDNDSAGYGSVMPRDVQHVHGELIALHSWEFCTSQKVPGRLSLLALAIILCRRTNSKREAND
jgi:hypothetical protein